MHHVGHAGKIGADVQRVGEEKRETRQRQDRLGKFPAQGDAQPGARHHAIRAHIICTADISGQESMAVHSMLVPSCAPAIE